MKKLCNDNKILKKCGFFECQEDETFFFLAFLQKKRKQYSFTNQVVSVKSKNQKKKK